ncbi:hypothetical protein DCS_04045 [Drechmeria coniospora]|uniref:Uncharacterized protein n=1 Tax=Drechmeria coniospora TaxID=98403 RepID=A0A151GIX5_DRECN|nr:hypothetical protein DCS_04045 [Drechmeria coniospora]KYK57038.1 hypothetical protein DCS_04045 [Drechmeria coniospora]
MALARSGSLRRSLLRFRVLKLPPSRSRSPGRLLPLQGHSRGQNLDAPSPRWRLTFDDKRSRISRPSIVRFRRDHHRSNILFCLSQTLIEASSSPTVIINHTNNPSQGFAMCPSQRTQQPAARRVQYMWICHNCAGGTMLYDTTPACVFCGHIRCAYCVVSRDLV